MNCEGPDCQEALEKLHVLIDSEIEFADCGKIQAHLDECPDCMDEFTAEQFVKALVMRSCRDAAPDVLRERVLFSIRTVSVEISFED